MRHTLLLLLLTMLLSTPALAQEFVQISTGPGYAEQSFYSLADNAETRVAHTSWDLMFTTIGLQDAGIHLNEATFSSFTAPAPELELYRAPTNDFEAAIDPAQLTERLYNDEQSWLYGAFNATRDTLTPLDFGWGQYNPAIQTVVGTQVFVLKLRDGQYKKIMVESLTQAYTLRYADLDGSNEQTAEIDKTDFAGQPFAFFSFANQTTLTGVPDHWDLLFTRYVTPLDDGSGQLLNYVVTGILSGLGVEVAEITGLDPAEVGPEAATGYDTALDVIGYDWKAFDFTEGWVLPTDLSYLVKTADNHLYKLVFVDFEGSSTGTATFEKTDLGIVSSDHDIRPQAAFFNVFPNPVRDRLTLAFDLDTPADRLDLQLFDARGALVWEHTTPGGAGLQAREFDLPPRLGAGVYTLRVRSGQSAFSRQLILQR